MIIEILDLAERDLLRAFYFYENQEADLGARFLSTVFTDIESLES